MKQLYSRYFPTPSYLSMNSCALDISDKSIKYGELVATSLGLRLKRFGQFKIRPGIVVSGKIEDEKALVEILKALRIKEHLDFVRVSLPEEQMYLFTLSLPKMNMENIRETILLQIEEHIPLSASDTVFDYGVISETDQTIVIEVSAIAINTIETYLSVFEQAGLTPLSFELEAQAIARSVIPHTDMSPVMVVDFGDDRTGVSIAQNGRVLFTTTLDIGGVTLTDMIAKNFSISFEKAEEMKRSYSLDETADINEIFPVILNGISVLRDELNKHYIYWKTHQDGVIEHSQIERIILCGGDANLAGIADYLQATMQMKVEHANAWVNISDMTMSVPDMSFEESLGYATVLGLALGDYLQGSHAVINVLPQEEKNILKREYRMRYASVIFSLFSLMGVLGTVLLFPSYFFSVSKVALAEHRLEEFNRANPQMVALNIDSTVADTNEKLALLSAGGSSYQIHQTVLGELLKTRPSNITFSQIFYSESVDKIRILEVHGVARDRTALRDFKTALEKNNHFTNIVVPLSDFLEKSEINFTLTVSPK